MRKNAMMYDPLYFSRSGLAEIIAKSLYGGITHAFTLFAPRRMGKRTLEAVQKRLPAPNQSEQEADTPLFNH